MKWIWKASAGDTDGEGKQQRTKRKRVQADSEKDESCLFLILRCTSSGNRFYRFAASNVSLFTVSHSTNVLVPFLASVLLSNCMLSSCALLLLLRNFPFSSHEPALNLHLFWWESTEPMPQDIRDVYFLSSGQPSSPSTETSQRSRLSGTVSQPLSS